MRRFKDWLHGPRQESSVASESSNVPGNYTRSSNTTSQVQPRPTQRIPTPSQMSQIPPQRIQNSSNPSSSSQTPTAMRAHLQSRLSSLNQGVHSSAGTSKAHVPIRPRPSSAYEEATAPYSDTLMRQQQQGHEAVGPDPEKEMVLHLSCPICMDFYHSPVLLPCLHSMCKTCAEAVRVNSDPFLCPECKQRVGNNPLKRNFMLDNIVGVFKRDMEQRSLREQAAKTEKVAKDTKYDKHEPVPDNREVGKISLSNPSTSSEFGAAQLYQCDGCGGNPYVKCVQCNFTMCRECIIKLHPEVESTPDHTLIPILQCTPKEAQSANLHQCDGCGGNPYVKCVQCNFTMCDECIMTLHPEVESTPDHTLIPIPQCPPRGTRLANFQGRTYVQTRRHKIQNGLLEVMKSLKLVQEELVEQQNTDS